MKTLALYSLKGGVGKTVAAVNLAHLAALHGYRVLLWDLDPQAAASWYLKTKPNMKRGVTKAVKGKVPIGELVRKTRHERLDILPADFSGRHLDLDLDGTGKPGKRLAKLMQPFAETYSLLILDCPPSISLTSDNVFRAADVIAVPIIPTPQILHVYRQTRQYLKAHNFERTRLRAFLSMVDRRRRLHNELVSVLPNKIKGLLATDIPYCAAVENMSVHRAPLMSCEPASPATRRYLELWLELEHLLG